MRFDRFQDLSIVVLAIFCSPFLLRYFFLKTNSVVRIISNGSESCLINIQLAHMNLPQMKNDPDVCTHNDLNYVRHICTYYANPV